MPAWDTMDGLQHREALVPQRILSAIDGWFHSHIGNQLQSEALNELAEGTDVVESSSPPTSAN